MSVSQFRVNALALNLRLTPEVNSNNRIAVLPQGQIVNILNKQKDPWWKVSTIVNGQTLEGFVSSNHLSKVEDTENNIGLTSESIPAVHLIRSSLVSRDQESGRAFALNEVSQPKRNTTNPAKSLTEIINWLKVEQSERYQPGNNSTFCNIYAYDYCYLADVFLPRVWWTRNAIVDLQSGKQVPIRYGETVRELNANSIFDWFEDYANSFGWVRVFDLTELQEAANQGQVCIINAQRVNLNNPGHICAVVPEINDHKASREGSEVIMPLQSQAGGHNFRYGVNTWWKGSQFRNFSFWKHA